MCGFYFLNWWLKFFIYILIFKVRIDVRFVVIFYVYIVYIIVIVNKFIFLIFKERDVSIELKLYG